MSTCPPNLAHSFLTNCKIITFKVDKNIFSPMPKEDNKVLKAKKKLYQVGMDCVTFYSCL
jgi:hypothetical protein